MLASGQDKTETTADWRDVLAHNACGDHIVQVYQEESFLAEAVAHFVEAGLAQGQGIVIIATPAHWDIFARYFSGKAIDLDRYIACGQIAILDAEQTLASFICRGAPDWTLFRKAIAPVLDGLSARYGSVRAYGEMVDVLWQRGEHDAANQLEEYWDRLARTLSFSLLCAYCVDHLDPNVYGGPLERICRAHSHVIPTRDYKRLETAIEKASESVLGPAFAQMLRSLATMRRGKTQMPMGQSTLLYLNENMPLTARAVMEKTRIACADANPEPS